MITESGVHSLQYIFRSGWVKPPGTHDRFYQSGEFRLGKTRVLPVYRYSPNNDINYIIVIIQ